MRISLVTFGCRLNRAEALDLEARLTSAGHAVCPLPEEDDATSPDLVIVRGCSVTAKAQHDSEKAIARLRERFPAARVVRMGCLPNALLLPQLLADTRIGIAEEHDRSQPPVPMATSRAYLKIQDGCSGKCAYCIVPHFRGAPVSMPFGEILARAEAFIEAGYREIVVTGCNLALYKDGGKRLHDVLDALAKVRLRGFDQVAHRVRLSSLEPGLCGAEVLDVMERNANICRFLHLSLQSGSDDVLRRMNRPYDMATVAEFVADARIRFGAELCLGADVIAGFPGEGEADFERTRAFLAECDFCNVHAFPYSERPGTAAAAMTDSVPVAVRRRRAGIVIDGAKERKRRFAARFVGREVEVCVERGGGRGWSGEYLPVRLATPRPRRSMERVRISAAVDGVLFE